MKYNPFRYIRNENDILKLVNCIMENTKGEDSKGGEDFWAKAEALYYQALIAYIFYEAPEEEKNMVTLLEMLNASEVREEDETFKNAVDLLFDQLKERDPDHFAVRQYVKYKMAAGKTAKSILISCGARMAPFDIKEVREMMEDDELELDKLGDRKTALFCIVSDVDVTFNFIAAMVYTQMFNVLCDKALENGGALNQHVTCLLDEFANQKIPNFQHLISVIRSREISAHIVVQTQSQLKALYKDNAETIIGNCSDFRNAGQGNNRPHEHFRHQRQSAQHRTELPKDRKGTHVHGRTGGDGWRQVHPSGSGRPSVLLRQVRHYPASAVQVPVRLRQEEHVRHRKVPPAQTDCPPGRYL